MHDYINIFTLYLNSIIVMVNSGEKIVNKRLTIYLSSCSLLTSDDLGENNERPGPRKFQPIYLQLTAMALRSMSLQRGRTSLVSRLLCLMVHISIA